MDKVDFYRHIRNAVAHSHIRFVEENETQYVTFTDNNTKTHETSEIFLKKEDVVELMRWLLKSMVAYVIYKKPELA